MKLPNSIQSSSNLQKKFTSEKFEKINMKLFAVLMVCFAGALAVPNYYNQPQPDIRIESYTSAPAPAPADTPTSYYSAPAPVLKSHYEAPALKSTYETPAIRTDSYGSSLKSSSVPQIVRHHVQSDNSGNYNMQVESSDGSSQSETGSLKNLGGSEGPAAVKQGSFSWTSPEGQRFTLSYTADEKGFQPTAAHLPTSPPIPEEIQKSLLLPRVQQDSYSSYTPSAPASPPMNSYYSAPPADTPRSYY